MIQVFRRTVRDSKPEKLPFSKDLKGCCVYCTSPSRQEIHDLSSALGIDSSLITDVLDPFEVPRLDQEDGVVHAISSFPLKDGARLLGIPFSVTIGENAVAVISSRQVHFLEKWFEEGTDFVTTQKTKLVNTIFKRLMEEYYSQMTEINREVHRVSLSPGRINNHDITKLVWFEEALNLILGDLLPTDAILRQLLSGKYLKLFKEDEEEIEDTVLYTEQLMEMVKSNLKKISNIRDAYSAILTANLNGTMKFLTAATVILTVPTIVASIYGMNVNLPLSNHPYAFIIIVVGIIISTLVLTYFFIKKNWM